MSKHHIKPREQRRIMDYAMKVLGTLGENKWRVLLMVEPSDDDAYGSVNIAPEKYVVELYLAENWHELSNETRRNTITHEMLHVVHKRVDHVVYDLDPLLRHDEQTDLRTKYQREIELMVDHFATFMSDTHSLTEEWDEAWARAAKSGKETR